MTELAAILEGLRTIPARLEAIEQRQARIEKQLVAMAERADQLKPLHELIPGLSPKAAQMRLSRDPDLRKLGVRVGRSTLFTAEMLRAYAAQKGAK
jgi:hypothetical protein